MIFEYFVNFSSCEGEIIHDNSYANYSERPRCTQPAGLCDPRQCNVKFKKGESLAEYDPNTNELLNGSVLEDELDFDVSDFKILTKPIKH